MGQQDNIRIELPATHKYLNVLGAAVNALLTRVDNVSDPELTFYNIELAVHEICTNVVDHAYADRRGDDQRIDVTLTLVDDTPATLIIDIRDTGREFDPTKVAEPDLQNGQVRGYGLFLTRALVDSVEYQRDVDQNHWRLTVSLD